MKILSIDLFLPNKVDWSSSLHFDGFNSSNWNSVRFKQPTSADSGSLPWRVEFRSMEVQLSDFENAAFAVFTQLLCRAALLYPSEFELYIPMSLCERNMTVCQQRDACRTGKLHWRSAVKAAAAEPGELGCDVAALMTMREIMCGSRQHGNTGLVDWAERVLSDMKDDATPEQLGRLAEYVDFMRARATGKVLTAAQWLREYIAEHPLYGRDSTLSEELCRDIVETVIGVNDGSVHAPSLLGDLSLAERRECVHLASVSDLELKEAFEVLNVERNDEVQDLSWTGGGVHGYMWVVYLLVGLILLVFVQGVYY